MASLRETLKSSPWIGWVVALALFGLAAYLYFGRGARTRAYDPEQLKEFVTIRYADTGDEERMRRGAFEKMLRMQSPGMLDPSKGIINPKTNEPTGFLIDKDGWEETCKRINAERQKFGGGGAAARPDAPAAPAGDAGAKK